MLLVEQDRVRAQFAIACTVSTEAYLVATSNKVIGPDRELLCLLESGPPPSMDNVQSHDLVAAVNVLLVVLIHKGL